MTDVPILADDFENAASELIEGEGLNVDTFQGMFQLFRLSALMFNNLESGVHKPAGWSLAGFRVMFILWVAGDLEPRDIARLAGLSRAAISSALNTLERDGLVERRRESADRRLVTVSLTSDGAQRLSTAYAEQNTREAELFASLSADELATLTQLMRRVSGRARSAKPADSE